MSRRRGSVSGVFAVGSLLLAMWTTACNYGPSRIEPPSIDAGDSASQAMELYDANGDGFGDFVGLTEKLDYLQWLGVDCLWLLPFYQSPLRDGGYDISDFFTVLPAYGDVDELQACLGVARAAAQSGGAQDVMFFPQTNRKNFSSPGSLRLRRFPGAGTPWRGRCIPGPALAGAPGCVTDTARWWQGQVRINWLWDDGTTRTTSCQVPRSQAGDVFTCGD